VELAPGGDYRWQMRATVLDPTALGRPELEHWSSLQCADLSLASPFFRPEFAQAVATVRDDALVAVIEDAGRIAGFFPFHRRPFGIGRPIGGRLSDYQGVIAEPSTHVDPRWLLRQCGLRAMDFRHLVAGQSAFTPFHTGHASSPQLELWSGFDAYRADRARAGSRAIGKIERSATRLAADLHEPIRFVAEDPDPAALAVLCRWKSEQHRRRQQADVLSLEWVVDLLRTLQHAQSSHFAGMLSTLYVGDRLIAAHMGMRSRDHWHYWLPAYDPGFGRYSPGLILLVEMAKDAGRLGVGVIDMGRGDEAYKQRLMTAAFPLAEASVVVSRPLMGLRDVAGRLQRAGRRTRLAGPVKLGIRSMGLRWERLAQRQAGRHR
jgi:CelD/BcsL family acetyltransferase involved in cellulose biosynthesis